MAITQCPEYGGNVSTRVATRPHCGCPVDCRGEVSTKQSIPNYPEVKKDPICDVTWSN
jgi:hypothetical protein